MKIKHIGMSAHPGGLTKIIAIVDGDRTAIGELVMSANADIDESPYELKIEKFRVKRSLDANAYYHVLLTKLAKALRTSTDELHSEMLKRYGVLAEREDGSIITFIHPSDKDPKEIHPYSKPIRYGEIDGKPYTAYAALKGSSQMNTSEFSALLDGLISECKDQGIETMTPLELEQLKGYANGYKIQKKSVL